MSTAYLNGSDDVLATADAAVAPTLAAYQNRVTEATQIITGAPDELVGKLSLGRGGVWTYHQKTSGDGTLIGHYTVIEDVTQLAASRIAEIDAKTAQLLVDGPIAVVDYYAQWDSSRPVVDAGVALKASIGGASTQAEIDAIVDTRVATDAPSSPSNIEGYQLARGNLVALGSVNGAVTIDCKAGNDCRGLLDGNVTSVTLNNLPGVGVVQRLTVVLKQAAASSYTIPLAFTGVDWWTNGTGPVMPVGFGKTIIITVYMNGTEQIGSWVAEP